MRLCYLIRRPCSILFVGAGIYRVPVCIFDYHSLTLYMLILQRKHKHVFAYHVIPRHWRGTGNYNPTSSKTWTYLFCIVNIMGVDVLAMQGARASAIMISINSVPHVQS